MLSLGIGSGGVAIGELVLILVLVHRLHAVAGLPLWACYGIVRDRLAISGAVFFVGKNTIARLDVVPPHTVETMKENVQWIKERATSDGTSKAHVPR